MEERRSQNGMHRSAACAADKLLAAAVRDELERILASPDFNVPARVRQFLTYVVDMTLAGHADRIKAYSVAVEVFGRDASFDIQNDPVVRIEAGRLRRALERYYLLAGSSDPVLIEIPKGGYVPRFQHREGNRQGSNGPEQSAGAGRPAPDEAGCSTRGPRWFAWASVAAATAIAIPLFLMAIWPAPTTLAIRPLKPEGPVLLVRPFSNLSGQSEINSYVAGLGEELLGQLSRFKELTVFRWGTAGDLPPDAADPMAKSPLGNRYILEGGIRLSGDKLRVTSRVLNGEDFAIVWSGTHDANLRAGEIVNVEATIASKIATAIAQPYGAIFSVPPQPTQAGRAQEHEAYRCTYRFYRYRTVLDGGEHAATRECLERITARYPDYATGWAMLSYLYLDEDRFQLNKRVDAAKPLQRARTAAERAVRLDPENVRALQALMSVLYFSQEPAEAMQIGSRALAINPNDTELIGEFGGRVAQAGDWQRGAALLEDAMARNPGHSEYYVGLLALAAYMQGDHSRAANLIRRASLQRFSIYHFVAALVFARQGSIAEVARHRAEFLRMRPGFFDDLDGELLKRNFNARDRAMLIRGAIEAGFPVPVRFAAEAGQG